MPPPASSARSPPRPHPEPRGRAGRSSSDHPGRPRRAFRSRAGTYEATWSRRSIRSRGLAGLTAQRGPAALMLGVETGQLLVRRRPLALGDRSMLLLQPADELLKPVTIVLEPQRLGDIGRDATFPASARISSRRSSGLVTVTFFEAILLTMHPVVPARQDERNWLRRHVVGANPVGSPDKCVELREITCFTVLRPRPT